MPSLQVRELPENIYRLLQQKAKKEHRSLAQEAVVALAKGLQTSDSPISRRKKLLLEIKESHAVNDAVKQIDQVDLIREDRER